MMPVPMLTENHDGTKLRTRSPSLERFTAPCRASSATPAWAKKPFRSLGDSISGSIASSEDPVVQSGFIKGGLHQY